MEVNHQKTKNHPELGLHLMYEHLHKQFHVKPKQLRFMYDQMYSRAIVNSVCEIILRKHEHKIVKFNKK